VVVLVPWSAQEAMNAIARMTPNNDNMFLSMVLWIHLIAAQLGRNGTSQSSPIAARPIGGNTSPFYMTYSFLPNVGAEDVPHITVYVRQCFRHTAS
jgi:hypothetical protein